MSTKSKKIERLLKDAGLAIKNAKDLEEIKVKIKEYGFNENMLQQGEELLTKTDDIYKLQKELRGRQKDLNVKLKEQIDKVRNRYITFRNLSRIELKEAGDEGFRKTLGIDGKSRVTLAGVLNEAAQFYDALLANEDIQKRLEKFELTKENIQQKISELEELKRVHESYKKKKGEAQQSTIERDALYNKLNDWWSEFRAVCKSVFADDPQQMEKLGITVLSESYKKRKAAQNAAEKKEKEEVPAATGVQASEK